MRRDEIVVEMSDLEQNNGEKINTGRQIPKAHQHPCHFFQNIIHFASDAQALNRRFVGLIQITSDQCLLILILYSPFCLLSFIHH